MLLVLVLSLKVGMVPSTMLLAMKVESNSGPTPLNVTPRKSLSVFSMPCFIAYRCTCFTPGIWRKVSMVLSSMHTGLGASLRRAW